MTNAIKLVVADQHPMVRDALNQLLNGQENMEVIGSGADGFGAVSMAQELRPDVLILDLAMPHMNGLETVQMIHSSVPETSIVIHSMHKKDAYIHKAFSAGAKGYVLKAAPSMELLNAILSVTQGQYFISS